MNKRSIDLNCDMGEGYPHDAELMQYISSANIACGYHAGDESTMRKTIILARQNNVAIGAHPGFADKENFGRIEINFPVDEVYELVKQQLIALDKICNEEDAILYHVKPHGALYNMAARDAGLAKAIAIAVKEVSPTLLLYGLSGSHLVSEADKLGLKTANEVFADRTYQDDGSLTPRSLSNAMVDSMEKSIKQVLQMVRTNTVTSENNKVVPVHADTICIHGDGPHALEFAKAIRDAFSSASISIQPPQQ